MVIKRWFSALWDFFRHRDRTRRRLHLRHIRHDLCDYRSAIDRLETRTLLSGSPVLVKDINTTPEALGNLASLSNYTVVNGILYFTTKSLTTGVELWKTDGTEAGTTIVKDIYAGTTGSDPGFLTNLGGTLFFSANDGVHGRELWKSDGTENGTVLVKNIDSSTFSSNPTNLVSMNNTLFFKANSSSGTEIWKSNGTESGTVLLEDISFGSGSSVGNFLVNVNGTLFFDANDGIRGSELWKSDGTEAGTTLV